MLEPDSPWRRLVSLRSGAKAGAVAVVGSLILGGVAAAATGVVPTGPLQGVADLFGVTSSQSAEPQSDEPSESASASDSTEPSESESPSSTSPTQDTAVALATPTGSFSPTSGPNPLGPAAWGLCHAFGNKTWGNGAFATSTESPNPDGRKPDNPSVAYANLKAAAASVGQTVDGFCTLVLQDHGLPSAWPSVSQSSSQSSQSTLAPSGVSSTAPSYTSRGNGHGHGHAGEHGKAKGLNRG